MLAPTHCKTSEQVEAEKKRLKEYLRRLVHAHQHIQNLSDNPLTARQYLKSGALAASSLETQMDVFHALRLVLCEDTIGDFADSGWSPDSYERDRQLVLNEIIEQRSMFDTRRLACMRLMTMIQATEYSLEALGSQVGPVVVV